MKNLLVYLLAFVGASQLNGQSTRSKEALTNEIVKVVFGGKYKQSDYLDNFFDSEKTEKEFHRLINSMWDEEGNPTDSLASYVMMTAGVFGNALAIHCELWESPKEAAFKKLGKAKQRYKIGEITQLWLSQIPPSTDYANQEKIEFYECERYGVFLCEGRVFAVFPNNKAFLAVMKRRTLVLAPQPQRAGKPER